jgi:hypothetical protein
MVKSILVCSRTTLQRLICFPYIVSRSQDSLKWRVLYGSDVPSFLSLRHRNEYDVTLIVRHPHFNVSLHGNDVALVRLATAIGQDQATPICLPEIPDRREVTDGHGCYVTGWGKTGG